MRERAGESDWKKYSSMTERLRERYLEEKNRKFAGELTAPGKNATGRFWDTLEEMEKEAKTLRRCLDPHSRSSMSENMLQMLLSGMLKEEELEEFSPELRKELKSLLEIFRERWKED